MLSTVPVRVMVAAAETVARTERIREPTWCAADGVHAWAATRMHQVKVIARLRDEGLSALSAARRVGISQATSWRWRLAGIQTRDGVASRQAFLWPTGRRSELEKLGVTAAILDELRRLHVIGGTAAAAVRAFVRSPNCPRPLAAYLRRHLRKGQVPASLIRATGLQRVKLDAFRVGSRVFLRLDQGNQLVILNG